jgi:hypothetical protein
MSSRMGTPEQLHPARGSLPSCPSMRLFHHQHPRKAYTRFRSFRAAPQQSPTLGRGYWHGNRSSGL